jgi:hypothetical protein
MTNTAKNSRRRARQLTSERATASVEPNAADHQAQVAVVAYFLAEKRGFESGHELEDWLAAEAEIARAEQPCDGA